MYASTTLDPRVTSFDVVKDRIKMHMGHPMVNIELDDSQIYDAISQGCEWFTKYAGVTEEYLIFDASLYEAGMGIRLDNLFSCSPEMHNPDRTDVTGTSSLSAGWDYDLDSYRKVVDVFSFEQGNSSGVNTLFTLEQTVANQMYYGHMLGSMGFDLVTWEAMKQWLDLRSKVLAQTPYVRFNANTQYMRIIPEPRNQSNSPAYYGLIGCRVEKPIRDVVKERWVYRYALALCKIMLSNVRGKFGGTALFGGQTVNYQDLLNQGVAEQTKLEEELMNTYGEVEPPLFFLG
jgi:hypothetical protein